MTIRCDLLEPTGDLEAAVNKLRDELLPLHAKAWAAKANNVGKPYDFNAVPFVQMWVDKALRVFMAYDGDTPVGYIVGLAYRPMTYAAQVFAVEDWYTPKYDVETALFDYMRSALRFIGCDEIVITQGAGGRVPSISGWKVAYKAEVTHFRKE